MARSAAIVVRDAVNGAAATVANAWLFSCRNALEDVGHGERYRVAVQGIRIPERRGRVNPPTRQHDDAGPSNSPRTIRQQSRRRSTDRLIP